MSLRPHHEGAAREAGGHQESGAQEVKDSRRFLEGGSGQSCGMLPRGQDEKTDKSLPVSMRWTPLGPQQELFRWRVGVEADGSGLRSKWEVRNGRQCVDSSGGKFGCEGEERGTGARAYGVKGRWGFLMGETC